MSFPKKPIKRMENAISVGGTDNVPPTSCPPSAHVSACAPAYVEPTGKAVPNEKSDMGIVRHPAENSPILSMEPAP